MKNPKALALMSPEYFKKSNLEDPKTVIVRFKKNGVKTLVKALEFEPANPETKKLIIESLFYKTLGGPEKVISKKKTREARAENLFLIADKEKNPEIRTQLIELAEAYYLPEEETVIEEKGDKGDKKTPSDKIESAKSSDDDEDELPAKEVKKTKSKSKKKKTKSEE